jgi:hypothetical protein
MQLGNVGSLKARYHLENERIEGLVSFSSMTSIHIETQPCGLEMRKSVLFDIRLPSRYFGLLSILAVSTFYLHLAHTFFGASEQTGSLCPGRKQSARFETQSALLGFQNRLDHIETVSLIGKYLDRSSSSTQLHLQTTLWRC